MLNNLNAIQFVETDASTIESQIITTYETLSKKTLYPGDPVRLFLQAIAVIIVQQRLLIDYSAKQNLLSYSEGELLDHVVLLVGVTRLPASKAMTTLRFTLSAPQQTVISIPKGSRVRIGEIYFETIAYSEVAAGETQIEVVAECMEEGEKGNGILPGQITELVDVFPFYLNVTNITKSSGGADIEDDESLRKRAFEAPHSFSNAGSDKAYAFWAKSVSSEIADVQVISPEPGKVSIFAINKEGEALSDELKEAVFKKCSEKHVKPLTDFIEVKDPLYREYCIKVKYWVDSKEVALSQTIQNQVTQAVEEFGAWQQTKIGRDINPSELLYRIMKAGAKRVCIQEPLFEKLDLYEVAKLKSCEVFYEGIEDE